MKIAIIVAMRKELDLLIPLINQTSTVSVNGFEFHLGTLGRADVVVMQCGIGKVNAAVGTLTLIENFHPGAIINTGVAGGTGGGAAILDVVIADRIAYHDVWCGPGTTPGQAAGCPAYFECPIDPAKLDIPGTRRGLIASGDIFVSEVETVRHILELYPDAIAVDMESAAIAQVCHIKGVPFVCIRVISDTPGAADNISQYQNFWDDAPQHTFSALQHVISAII